MSAQELKKFTHWVFDLDGTVIDSNQHYELSIVKILGSFGVSPSAEDIARAYQYFDPNDYFATFFPGATQVQNAVAQLVRMNNEHADEIPIFGGIKKIFEYLRSREVQISVWTGRDLASAKKILESSGLHVHLENCVSRSCVVNNKPYPDGLIKILNDSRLRHDEVVMIGDHEYDMQGARAAKVYGVSVNWENKSHSPAHLLSDRHFTEVSALEDWARSMYP